MFAQLMENPHWFWLSLGGLLLAAELLGTAGYLLWSGISAVLIGLLVWLLPLGWEWQWVCFSVLTVLMAVLWWYWLQKCHHPKRDVDTLNERNQQLIGSRATLTEPLVNGNGRLNVGDGSWRVQAETDIAVGSEVEVVGVEGITLKIRTISRTTI